MFNIADAINPYLIYIKIGAVLVTAGLLIWAGVWFRGVLAERDTLKSVQEEQRRKVDEANHRAALAEAAQQQYQQTIREVVDAVKRIRIQSNNYISGIETAPAPDVPDGGRVVLVPGGMPSLDAALAAFGNHSAGRAAAHPAATGSRPPGR